MADIGVTKNYLVTPNKKVEAMWTKVRIQEKKSQLAGFQRMIKECEQKIEDLREGVIVDYTAKAIMAEKEIAFMETTLTQTNEGGEKDG